jgi:activating signal cointegrator complex subunit 3
LSTTELGSITSHFYVKCDTMDIFCKEFGISAEGNERTAEELLEKKQSFKTDLDILKILAKAKEFDQIRMRNDELVEIKKIISRFWVLEEKPDFALKKMCSTDQGIV